ncbi:hypothetical protein CEXT_401621 [Caerostris extrusa]|uniref:Uncharacterized protein n=1 Tax=Caerostris extrusa TaxID=172846 RepID=A0AAV4U9S8_CAEEX|nr:hypothetical protein CEXT_401621 [Caerostris extrusa]
MPRPMKSEVGGQIKVSVRRNCAKGADGITHKEQRALLSNVSGDRSHDDGKTLPLMKSLFSTPAPRLHTIDLDLFTDRSIGSISWTPFIFFAFYLFFVT